MFKKCFSVFLVSILLFCSIGFDAFGAYNVGYMVPKNNKYTKTLSTVKLYGKYDYLNFFIKSNIPDGDFAYAIYSDSKYKNLVAYGCTKNCSIGEYTYTPSLNMDKMKSGTYYGMTFSAEDIEKEDTDKDSVRTFKIKVKRKANFNKKVVILKSVKSSIKGPVIRWNKLSGAKKYYVYRRNPCSSKWKKLGSTTATKFVDKSVSSKSASYVYTVKAEDKKGNISRYNYSGLYIDFVGTPKISSLKIKGNNSVLKWNKISGASGYNVYRRTNNGDWHHIAYLNNGLNTTFSDKTKKTAGVKYWYTVEAEGLFDECMVVKSNKTSGKSVIYVPAPSVKEISAGKDNVINVEWESVTGAVYDIYRRTKNTDWVLLGKELDVNSFEDNSEKTDGAKYIYAIRARIDTSYGKKTGHYLESEAFPFTAMPIIYSSQANDYGIEIKWTPVESATSYVIYNKVVGGDNLWERLGILSADKNNFVDTLSDVNGQYIYTVRADNCEQKGSYSSEGFLYVAS